MDQIPNPEWPEEVKKAYEHLKIPSLYDAVLANERLANEVRRQFKEIQTLNETIGKLNTQMGEVMGLLMGAIAEGAEEDQDDGEGETFEEQEMGPDDIGEYEITLFEERQERALRETRNALLDAVDAILELAKNSQQTLGALKKPIGKWFSFISLDQASETADLMVDHVNSVQYRLLGQLDELHISIIEAHPGDQFIPQKHRLLERVSGGVPGTIAHMIRVGYIQDNVVLRCADVAIYK